MNNIYYIPEAVFDWEAPVDATDGCCGFSELKNIHTIPETRIQEIRAKTVIMIIAFRIRVKEKNYLGSPTFQTEAASAGFDSENSGVGDKALISL